MAENIAFKVISGEQLSNLRTLSEFWRVHHAFFQKVFSRVILVGVQLKMIDLGAVLVDGTVLQANASKKRSRRIKALKQPEKDELEDQKALAVQGLVRRMIQEAEAADHEEDRLYGQEGYPAALFASEAPATDRLGRIREAIQKVEAAERKRLQRLAARKAKLFRLAWEGRGKGQRLKRTKRKPRKVRIKDASKSSFKIHRHPSPPGEARQYHRPGFAALDPGPDRRLCAGAPHPSGYRCQFRPDPGHDGCNGDG